MQSRNTKGTTLIELMISTAVVFIIMSAVYMLWHSNQAAARQCLAISNSTVSNQMILHNLASQLGNAVNSHDTVPVTVERHSNKVFIKIHTRKSLVSSQPNNVGPYIAEYELDKEVSQIKYRETKALLFDDPAAEDNDSWEISRCSLNDIDIEVLHNDNWSTDLSLLLEKAAKKLLRISIIDGSKENETALRLIITNQ